MKFFQTVQNGRIQKDSGTEKQNQRKEIYWDENQ
jgi:hypothetical protein